MKTSFRPVASKADARETLTEATRLLLVHDADHSRRLERGEFARFISKFMADAGYAGAALDDVIDFLITVAATRARDRRLEKVLEKNAPAIEALLAE